MPRYKLRTLLIVVALGPIVLGGCDSRTDHTIKTVKRGAAVVDEHAKEIEKAAEPRIDHQLPMSPLPSFKEVELPREQVEGHTAIGGVSLRCFVAVVADGELCVYVAQRNSPNSGKPTWHISVSVGNTEGPKAGIVRWPTSDELRACMLLTGQGDQVKFKAFKGEMAYLVHLVEAEQ